MQSIIDSKLQELESWFKSFDSVLIAFSGGVDSTLLAKTAFMSLGKRAIAVTADSPSIPRSELKNAQSLAKSIGIEHLVVNTNEMENPDYLKNSSNPPFFSTVLIVLTATFNCIERPSISLINDIFCKFGRNLLFVLFLA